MKKNNTSGMGLIEALLGAGLLVGVALISLSFANSVRIRKTNLTSKSAITNLAASIVTIITSRLSPSGVLNNPSLCSIANPVNPSVSNSLDPYCCSDAGNTTYCNPLRRALFCGMHATSTGDTQIIRSSATWARNFYSRCKSGTSPPCDITNNVGSVCAGDGLIFDSPTEVLTFLSLLPDPYTGTLGPESTPKEIRFKIEGFHSSTMDTPITCGTEPPVWSASHIIRITIKVTRSLTANLPDLATQELKIHLTWPKDTSVPSVITGVDTFAQNAGPDNAVELLYPTSGLNADNLPVDSLPNTYFRDGSVRADAQCVATKSGAGTSQPPGYVYPTEFWRKLVYQAQSSDGGATFFCKNGYAGSPTEVNSCCNLINNGQVAGTGGVIRAVWDTPFREGDVLAIALVDSSGNIGTPKNFIFSPGYCPLTNTYCSDGQRTGPEVPEQAANLYPLSGPGATCTPLPTWPAYTDSFACHPHDGCFGLCPNGTRTGQNCPAPASYCSAGHNWDSVNSRGCAPGLDCVTDLRCNDSVCDDCGQDSCANSTITITPVDRGSTPYSDTVNWPTNYVGVAGGPGGCPDTDTYCPANSPNGLSISGLGTSFLPKDSCGNSCPDGTRPPFTNCSGSTDDCGRNCPQPPVCGNSTCETGEDCSSCPGDCGSCSCGNGICEAGETCTSCSSDCVTCQVCGDQYCQHAPHGTETCQNCQVDCHEDTQTCYCGDGFCMKEPTDPDECSAGSFCADDCTPAFCAQ